MEGVSPTKGIQCSGRMINSNPYEAAADPEKYRKSDAALFVCATHGDAAVLCTTAGKTGRNGRSAAVGATIFWLTCPNINNLVARLERNGGVLIVAQCLAAHPEAMEMHVESHTVFEQRVASLLAVEKEFFFSHFVHPTDPTKRKYGNAGVGHATDFKCLHALVGQALCAAPNPVGMAVINYILFIHSLLPEVTGYTRTSDDCCSGSGGDSVSVSGTASVADDLRRLIDNGETFRIFLQGWLRRQTDSQGKSVTDEVRVLLPSEQNYLLKADTWYTWKDLDAVRVLEPDLCHRSLEVILFLEGRPPRARKKRRLN